MSFISFFEDLGNGIKDAGTAVAWGFSDAATTVAGGITEVATKIADGITGAANTVANGVLDVSHAVSEEAVSAWKETSSTATFVADSVTGVGMVVGNGVIAGTNMAVEYSKIGVEEAGKGLVAAGEYISSHICDIAVGSALSSIFVALAVDGEEEVTFGSLAAACTIGAANKTAIKAASDGVAVILAEPVSRVPGVLSVVKSKDNLVTILSWAINKAATQDPKLVVGTGGQVIAGVVIALITNLVCEGKFPAGGPVVWSGLQNTTPESLPQTAPTVYVEGSRLNLGPLGLFLVLDGQVRHIPDPDTYNNLFVDWNNTIAVNPKTVNTAAPLTLGAHLARGLNQQEVYLLVDGVKRWITSPTAFNRYRFNWSKIKTVDPAALQAIPTGMPICAIVRQEGAKVAMGPAIFLVLDGLARHIPNPQTFNQLFPNWNNIKPVAATTEAVGQPLSDGAYLAGGGADGKVYLVNQNVKRWIVSPDAFNKYHFSWGAIRKLSEKELNAIPTGATINA